jgi:hypothetical protein
MEAYKLYMLELPFISKIKYFIFLFSFWVCLTSAPGVHFSMKYTSIGTTHEFSFELNTVKA